MKIEKYDIIGMLFILVALLDGSSDPNPLKKVSGLILRNHVRALRDLCFEDHIQFTYDKCHITG